MAADLDDLAAVAAVHCGRYSAGSMSAAVVVEEAELPKYLYRMIENCPLNNVKIPSFSPAAAPPTPRAPA